MCPLPPPAAARPGREKPNASDHAPVWVELGAAKRTRKTTSVQTQAKTPAKTKRADAAAARRPLLVIAGASFAHRAYHALPKNILRDGGKPAGAILGFANMLLRLYQAERPRAVLVGWDTLGAATYRHRKYPAYQSGGDFDDAIVEQLDDGIVERL